MALKKITMSDWSDLVIGLKKLGEGASLSFHCWHNARGLRYGIMRMEFRPSQLHKGSLPVCRACGKPLLEEETDA